MNEILAVLGAVIHLGVHNQGPPPYTWEIAYTDGVTEQHQNVPSRLEYTARPGRTFRWRTQFQYGTWSDWSELMVVMPLEGDVNFDCTVGTLDFTEIRQNFGNSCE